MGKMCVILYNGAGEPSEFVISPWTCTNCEEDFYTDGREIERINYCPLCGAKVIDIRYDVTLEEYEEELNERRFLNA